MKVDLMIRFEGLTENVHASCYFDLHHKFGTIDDILDLTNNTTLLFQVIKATRKHAEPLAGSISYETLDDTKFIPYSERDISGEFTLFVGK